MSHELILAVKNNDIETVKKLLGKKYLNEMHLYINSYINQLDNAGTTALIWAARRGHIDMVKLLLANGANINQVDQYGGTALIFAATYGRPEIIKLLLANGAEINHSDLASGTALIWAIKGKRIDMAKILLASGADVNLATENGETALILAVKSGDTEFFKMLLDKNADVNHSMQNSETALIVAARNGQTEMVKMLLANGADANRTIPPYIETALMLAEKNGHKEIVIELLKNRKHDLNDDHKKILQQLLNEAMAKKDDTNFAEIMSTQFPPDKDAMEALNNDIKQEFKTSFDYAAGLFKTYCNIYLAVYKRNLTYKNLEQKKPQGRSKSWRGVFFSRTNNTVPNNAQKAKGLPQELNLEVLATIADLNNPIAKRAQAVARNIYFNHSINHSIPNQNSNPTATATAATVKASIQKNHSKRNLRF